MATTFLKRQKEMKRLEKQREKAERRAQKRLANRAQSEVPTESTNPADDEALISRAAAPDDSAPQRYRQMSGTGLRPRSLLGVCR